MFAKVNTQVEVELAATLNVRSIPTIMAFREGILVYRQPGAMPKPALEDLISQVEQLDMAVVHAKIAERKPPRRPSRWSHCGKSVGSGAYPPG